MSGFSQIIKVGANESSPYTPNNNNISFDIPSGMNIDFTKSHFEIDIRAIYTPDTDADLLPQSDLGNLIQRTVAKWGGADNSFFNVNMVKSGSIQGERVGLIESVQEVGFFQGNLNKILLSFDEKLSNTYSSFPAGSGDPVTQYVNAYESKDSLFEELLSEGDVMSSRMTASVPIKCSHIYGFANLPNVNTSKTGALNLKLELDISDIQAVIELPSNAAGDHTNSNIAMADLAGPVAAGELVNVVTTTVMPNANNFKFWVGQKVLFYGASVGDPGNGVAAPPVLANCVRMVKKIEHQIDNTAKITLSAPIINVALQQGQRYENCYLRPMSPNVGAPSTPTLSFDNVRLCLHLNPPEFNDGLKSYEFLTHKVQRSHGNGATSYEELFNADPNCVNAIVMTNDGTNSNNVSGKTDCLNKDIRNYRFIVDDEATTDRVIDLNFGDRNGLYSALARDQIVKTMSNGGYTVKTFAIDSYSAPFAMQPLKMTPNPKQVRLQINSDNSEGGLGNIWFYKQLYVNIGL